MSFKLSTFQSWKMANKYLTIDSTNTVLTCGICKKWAANFQGTNAFITGSKNLKLSAVSEHAKSKMHTRALRLEEEEQARADQIKIKIKIRVTVPPSSENSPITAAVSNMGRLGKEERSSILRLFDIAYLIAFKGRPHSDFTDIIELEKLHGVRFFSNSVYEKDMGCKIFIHFAAKALFEKEVKDKIKTANFITVLADGAADAALIEKEVVYILFVDPDEFKPSLEFLSLKSVASQDAQGITSAIVDAFQDCDISEKLKRIVFFESDGTSVNSGLRGGVISLLQQRCFWCLSHRIELGLKDALKKDMEEVDIAIRDLYYIYQNYVVCMKS